MKGVGSRRQIDLWIKNRRIKINNKIVDDLGVKVNPAVDLIAVDNEIIPVHTEDAPVYLLLNKPCGYLSSHKSQFGTPTIFELPSLHKHKAVLKYAGRLDKETSGLLVLTTDGNLIQKITHPSHQMTKTYRVGLQRKLSPQSMAAMKNGFDDLEDGPVRYLEITKIHLSTESLYGYDVKVQEGRNRLIRRIFSSLGHKVATLQRIQLGPLKIGSLPLGEARELNEKEIKALLTP
jgi:23S rRNA pseudouridine2605 synthase